MTEIHEIRETITFPKHLKLFGLLHRPLQSENVPAVLIIHGFGSNKVGTNRVYVKVAESLTKENIACIRLDLRGCGDSEGEISETSFEDFIEDILTALNHLKDQPFIDKNRIGILGSSLGGALAFYSAQKFQKVKAIVQWAAVASGQQWMVDWKRQYGDLPFSNNYRGTILSSLFQEQFFKMRADLISKELKHTALLNIHGEDDQVIPLIHQQAYRLQREELPHSSFLSFAETGHTLSLSPHFSQILKETVEWFKTQL